MPRYTLLEIVQDVLNEGDFDTVDTWDQTIESTAIANMAKTVFFELHVNGFIPSHRVMKNPDVAAGATYLAIPADVTNIFWIRDDSQDKELIFLDPKVFIGKLDTTAAGITDRLPFLWAMLRAFLRQC